MTNFDLMAKEYDTERRKKRATLFADKIRPYIADGQNQSAIEYGCGTGLVGLQLMDHFKSLLFIDSSSEMLKQVEHKLAKMNSAAGAVLCCDFGKEVPQGLQADCILLSLVLHDFKDTRGILLRFYDVLRDNGKLLIIDNAFEGGSHHENNPDVKGRRGFEPSFLVDLAIDISFTKAIAQPFNYGSNLVDGQEIPHLYLIACLVK